MDIFPFFLHVIHNGKVLAAFVAFTKGHNVSCNKKQDPLGPLMGGPQCRLSILRNDNVPCCYFSNISVDFKVVQCRVLNLRKRPVALSILRVKGPSLGGI